MNIHHVYSSRQDKVRTPISRNPYKLREAKEIEAKKDRTISDKSFHSTSPGEEVNTVTKLFCDWVASLVSSHYSTAIHLKQNGPILVL